MQTPKENPFLGLKPYGLEDQLYGRDKDLFLMTDRIFCARTTLLFAGSGVGKTSFINAKISPELKSQYDSIIYHNQWAIGQPLEKLLNSIAEHLPAVEVAPAVVMAAAGPQNASTEKPPHPFLISNKFAPYFKKFINEEGAEDSSRCLLILDQFEEVFQYHHGKSYFDLFIKQLAELINYKNCNVRVLFSMREEFLGELSIFDNRIPDLFSNYYRLKNPNKQEAKIIIENTSSLVEMPVHEDHLTEFVRELTWICRAESTVKPDQNGSETAVDLDIVPPPYLQIACRRLWERQFNSANSAKPQADGDETPEEQFLSDYKRGDAREMLKSFCEEILNAFNSRDRALIAEAFNYLVTKKGAKMAYALSSLAEHMGVKEERLQSVLHRLSDPDSRILRESKGPDDVLWYELYHDMYGKIIDEWRQAYREQQQAETRRRLIAAAGVIVIIGLLTVWAWQWLDRRNGRRATLRTGDLSKQLSYLNSKQAYDDLKDTWHSGTKAKELWGDAWKRRAFFAERTEDSSQAFLSLLKAAESYPVDRTDPALLAQIRSYLDSDEYQPLLASYRLEIGVTSSPAFKPILTADGKMLLSLGKDRQVFFWDTETYQLKLKSPQLAVEGGFQSGVYGSGPPSLQQHATPPGLSEGTQLQAATDSLIGGLDNNKFCIWDAKSGQKLWESEARTGLKPQISTAVLTGDVSSYYNLSSQQLAAQSSLSFSSNGHYFTTSNGSDSFLLYRLNDNNKGELILEELMRSVTKIQFSPDGHSVALIFKDGSAQLRDLDTGESRSLAIDGKSVRAIIFSSDGSRFIADMGVSKPGEIWNTASGSKITSTSTPMGDQFFCPDNKTIASILPVDESNTTMLGIRFWNSETGAVSIRAVRFDERTEYIINPNGKSLLTIGVSGNARLWSLTPPENADSLITDAGRILANDISDDGRVIVTANSNKSLTVWNADKLTKQGEFSLASTAPHSGEDFLFPPTRDHFVDQLLVSPSGKYVCLKTTYGNFSLRKLADNKVVAHGKFENNPFARPTAFSPTEEAFAVADLNGSVTLWDQLGSNPTAISLHVPARVNRLVFNPDGKYLAAIGGDFNSRYVRVFEVGTGKEMPLPTEGFTSIVALGRNGIMIGTTPNDDTAVIVWDFTKGRSHKLWHETSVTAVALSHEATYAVTSTSNGTLQLWDTSSGRPIAGGPCSTRILSLIVSDDGQTILALSDKWLHLHSMRKDALTYLDGRELSSPASLRVLDWAGKTVRILSPAVQDSLRVKSLDFSVEPTGDDPVGTAADFFSIWTRKLALDFDQTGRITPVHPH